MQTMNLTRKSGGRPTPTLRALWNLIKFPGLTITCLSWRCSNALNEDLQKKGEDPVVFDHDCREGICGACSLVINGRPHGPQQTTTCQLHMRSFKDGDTIHIEPWRAKAFPVIKDLMVDRLALMIQHAADLYRSTRVRPGCQQPSDRKGNCRRGL